MAGVNRVTIVGRLGTDPEVKKVGESTVATFSVATSESYKDKSNKKVEKTEWHRIVLWNKLADVAGNYLKKGRQVYIEGKLQTREWEKDGIKRYTTEIVGTSLQLLGDRPSDQQQQQQQNSGGGRSEPALPDDDSLAIL